MNKRNNINSKVNNVNRNTNSKINSSSRNPNSNSNPTSNTAKSLSSNKKKKLDKVAVGIVVLAVILVGLIGTQLVLNGPSTSSSSKASNYAYFNDLNNTFSAKFLEKLNAYRSENGLNNLSRVSKVSNGSSSTFTLPNLNNVANENNCDTEDKLATVVLQKFLASAENKQIATATVSKIYLDTTVSNNTLNLTVKVPFEK